MQAGRRPRRPRRQVRYMGMFDKAGDVAKKAEEQMADHPEQTEKYSDQGIEKGGDALDRLTGGKYADQVDKGQRTADEKIGE